MRSPNSPSGAREGGEGGGVGAPFFEAAAPRAEGGGEATAGGGASSKIDTWAALSSERMRRRKASLSPTVMVSLFAITGTMLTYGCSRFINSMSAPLRRCAAMK